MPTSTVSTVVVRRIVLGSGDGLTVTGSGEVDGRNVQQSYGFVSPAAEYNGLGAVYGTAVGATLTNSGRIVGGYGGPASYSGGSGERVSQGGVGVAFSAGSITNAGTILGGAGGVGEAAYNGGIGVVLGAGASGVAMQVLVNLAQAS